MCVINAPYKEHQSVENICQNTFTLVTVKHIRKRNITLIFADRVADRVQVVVNIFNYQSLNCYRFVPFIPYRIANFKRIKFYFYLYLCGYCLRLTSF